MPFSLGYLTEDEILKEDLFLPPCQAQKVLSVEEKVFIIIFGVIEHFIWPIEREKIVFVSLRRKVFTELL